MANETGPVFIPDGSFDWSGGVDSSRVTTIQSDLNPNGLKRNQLAWLSNGTVRAGGITQRPGWTRCGRIAAGGRWQGGFVYEPDSGNPYLVCSISGIIYKVLLESPYTVTNLTAASANPAWMTNPASAEIAWFCQGENYLVIQAGDFHTPGAVLAGRTDTLGRHLPLYWDGTQLLRSAGLTGVEATSELPAATCMDYYGGRIWYAQGRVYSAGDIVGGPSGTAPNHYRDAVIKVTENPLAFGGDGFTVPTNAGNVRALKHSADINAPNGEGPLYIFTRKAVYSLQVPNSRYEWMSAENDGTNADSGSMPRQAVVQLVNGATGDRCIVSVNGDLFYQSLDPAIRSLITATRYFQQWGNTPISKNEQRALALNDRALMRFSSGIHFDGRVLQAVMPKLAADGINVVHDAILPLDFEDVSNLPQDSTAPAWEGAYDGLQHLQLFEGDFGGLPRAFSVNVSILSNAIELWELSTANKTEEDDRRVVWSPEFPAFTWSSSKLDFKLKHLKGGELWVDKLSGVVDVTVYYREDAAPCWQLWHNTTICAGRCEDVDTYTSAYPCEPFREGYVFPVVFPEPPSRCGSMGVRPSTIGYQFQVKIMLKGYCRIRGLILYATPHAELAYRGVGCSTTAIPQGMAQLPNPFV